MKSKNPESATVGRVLQACTGPFLILALAIYFYGLACCIGPTPVGQLGADFWPKMVLIFLMISCVIKFGEIIQNRHSLSQKVEARPKMDNMKLGILIGLLLITVFAIDYIGFALANFLFMIAFLSAVGLRRIPSLLLISGLGTIGMLYVFIKVVYLPLPKGMGFFEDISLFIYHALLIM
jgi:putative tricarboxylic transport membrane protein